jgi:hypothetical protein
MQRMFASPVRLVLILLFLTAIPIVVSIVRLFQIPLGQLPDISLHLTDTPIPHFLHALAGASFGIIGPIQFAGVLQRNYGRLHKVLGYVFVSAGAFLAYSSLHLLFTHTYTESTLLNTTRFIAASGVGICLTLSMISIFRKRIRDHRAWMIRSYALGMGSATIVFFAIPYLLITGQEADGLAGDMLFIASWVINFGIAEWVIRRPYRPVKRINLAATV